MSKPINDAKTTEGEGGNLFIPSIPSASIY
jgi:hypothetical protein